jgi:hypothetical protein
MRAPDRIIVTAGALALALALGGCESLSNFGGLEDFFSTKRPLPGERKAVFPEGVPGVAQGVPPELMRSNQPTEAQAAVAEPAETASVPAKQEPAAAAPPKQKAQPKKEATRARPPAEPSRAAAPPAARQEPADQPWPAPTPTRQQSAEQPWPAPSPRQQPSSAPWPDAPPPGTFQR